MADKTIQTYDDPNYIVRQGAMYDLPAGTANTVAARFKAFAKTKIKSIRAHVVVAGTADAAVYTIAKGTTSVGVLTMGTATAGTELTPFTTDISLERGEYVTLTRIATSGATMAAAAVIEYVLDPFIAVED